MLFRRAIHLSVSSKRWADVTTAGSFLLAVYEGYVLLAKNTQDTKVYTLVSEISRAGCDPCRRRGKRVDRVVAKKYLMVQDIRLFFAKLNRGETSQNLEKSQ